MGTKEINEKPTIENTSVQVSGRSKSPSQLRQSRFDKIDLLSIDGLFLFQKKCKPIFFSLGHSFLPNLEVLEEVGSSRKWSEVVGSGRKWSEVAALSAITDIWRMLIVMANPFWNPGTTVWPVCFSSELFCSDLHHKYHSFSLSFWVKVLCFFCCFQQVFVYILLVGSSKYKCCLLIYIYFF